MFKSDRPYLELTGRILISLIFLIAGIGKLMDWFGTAEYMASKGMTAIPFVQTMAVLFELGAGTCVLLGWHTRWAALALIVFLIPTTLIFHNFWVMEGTERVNNMHHFLKNLAIMGQCANWRPTGQAGSRWTPAAGGRRSVSLTCGSMPIGCLVGDRARPCRARIPQHRSHYAETHRPPTARPRNYGVDVKHPAHAAWRGPDNFSNRLPVDPAYSLGPDK
jgi:putative oxidoreductase